MIDLRSDWVAPPTEAMWEAMRAADWRELLETDLIKLEVKRRASQLLSVLR